MAPRNRCRPAGAAACILLAQQCLLPAQAVTFLSQPPPPADVAAEAANVDGRRRVESDAVLPHHLESLRREPFGAAPARSGAHAAVSLPDARAHLRRGLQAAWHIGNHYGHQWSTVAMDPSTVGRRTAGSGDGSCGMPGGRRVKPTDHGADPSGQQDSTKAMLEAMTALLDTGESPKSMMADNIRSLGGATLDLDGGVYLISQPLVIPGFLGNVGIAGGTLRATERFPQDRWLVEIGDAHCKATLASGKTDQQACCNQFVKVEDVLLDAAHKAAGGVRVMHTMGATIGPSVFSTGFTKVGARVDAGHEVMIQQAWFAEFYSGQASAQLKSSSESVGVQLNGADHVLTDVIVFDFAHIGVEVNGPANMLQNVHTWIGGGTGIVVQPEGRSTRLLGCYLDGGELVIHDPKRVTVESTFFLEAHVTLKSTKSSRIEGLRFRGNTYAGGAEDPQRKASSSIVLDGLSGGAADIQDELTGGPQLKLTSARRSLHQQEATKWVFDFSDVLLLPEIDEVVYSFVSDSDSGFVRHLARKPAGRTVVVETDGPVSGTATVEVTQGKQASQT